MTISAGNQITASDINTEEGANRAAMSSEAADAEDRTTVSYEVLDLDNSAAKTLEGICDFVPDDDHELIALQIRRNSNSGSGDTLTLTLSAPDDDTYLNGDTPSVSFTTASTGVEGTATEWTDTTATRYSLLRGVRYRLALTSDRSSGADQMVCASLVMQRTRRRA